MKSTGSRSVATSAEGDGNRDASNAAIEVAGGHAEEGAIKPKKMGLLTWLVALTCLVSGVGSVMSIKWTGRNEVAMCDGCERGKHDHPFVVTFVMFAGESMCGYVWLFDELYMKKKRGRRHGVFERPSEADQRKRPTPLWWWTLPTLVDLIGSSAVNAAFAMTNASTVQILRNSMLCWCAIITMVMMKRPLRVHEWLGIVVMTAGMVASAVAAILKDDGGQGDRAWLGIVLALAGTVFASFQLIVEEKFFEKTYTPPMKGVGIEGLVGLILTVFVTLICHYAKWYNFTKAIYQIKHSVTLRNAYGIYLLFAFVFNASGLLTTFLASGLLRGVIFSFRAPIVYILELCFKWTEFGVLELFSVILSVLGFFIFAYFLPFINRRTTPHTHALLRKGVPCFCTLPLEDSTASTDPDVEVRATPQKQTESSISKVSN